MLYIAEQNQQRSSIKLKADKTEKHNDVTQRNSQQSPQNKHILENKGYTYTNDKTSGKFKIGQLSHTPTLVYLIRVPVCFQKMSKNTSKYSY